MSPVVRAILELMDEHKLRQKDLMVRTGLGRTTIWRHLEGEVEPNVEQREAYASAFGVSPAEFEQRWKALASAAEPATEKKSPFASADAFVAQFKKPRKPRVLPEFSGVSAMAKGLTSAQPLYQVEVNAEMKGEFVVPLKGECMEPRYLDGERVVLSVEQWKAEDFRDNQDYLVVFTSGLSTFKRVKEDPDDADLLWFIPLNENEKNKRWSEPRKNVRFAARWAGTLPPR